MKNNPYTVADLRADLDRLEQEGKITLDSPIVIERFGESEINEHTEPFDRGWFGTGNQYNPGTLMIYAAR